MQPTQLAELRVVGEDAKTSGHTDSTAGSWFEAQWIMMHALLQPWAEHPPHTVQYDASTYLALALHLVKHKEHYTNPIPGGMRAQEAHCMSLMSIERCGLLFRRSFMVIHDVS